MDTILKRYIDDYGSFVFRKQDNLRTVCCAPNQKAGVYLFYDVTNGEKNLIYIGCSGHINNDGKLNIRKSGLRGIKGRIVNGHQFKLKRYESLPLQMEKDNIEVLEIHWFATHTTDFIHSPSFVESCLLQDYYEENGKLPKWNKRF
ncbi:hypothetical protein V6B16_03760 [Salinimicrobium catena]|uniref:hypothetical protein n=1 Tax=Salinimicrobium catena TaxID=390640 RepID=UPI002FE44305